MEHCWTNVVVDVSTVYLNEWGTSNKISKSCTTFTTKLGIINKTFYKPKTIFVQSFYFKNSELFSSIYG